MISSKVSVCQIDNAGFVLLTVFGAALLLVLGVTETLDWLRGWPSLGDPGSAFAEPDKETWPRVVFDDEQGQIRKEQAPGKVDWVTPADYLGRGRPPHLVFDSGRVYSSHTIGVAAVDASTGKCVWHSPGPQDRLCVSGDLLLAVQCGDNEFSKVHGNWLFARSTKTGAVVFKIALNEPSNADEIRQLADLFLMQEDETSDGAGYGVLIDRQGRVRHRF